MEQVQGRRVKQIRLAKTSKLIFLRPSNCTNLYAYCKGVTVCDSSGNSNYLISIATSAYHISNNVFEIDNLIKSFRLQTSAVAEALYSDKQ